MGHWNVKDFLKKLSPMAFPFVKCFRIKIQHLTDHQDLNKPSGLHANKAYIPCVHIWTHLVRNVLKSIKSAMKYLSLPELISYLSFILFGRGKCWLSKFPLCSAKFHGPALVWSQLNSRTDECILFCVQTSTSTYLSLSLSAPVLLSWC